MASSVCPTRLCQSKSQATHGNGLSIMSLVRLIQILPDLPVKYFDKCAVRSRAEPMGRRRICRPGRSEPHPDRASAHALRGQGQGVRGPKPVTPPVSRLMTMPTAIRGRGIAQARGLRCLRCAMFRPNGKTCRFTGLPQRFALGMQVRRGVPIKRFTVPIFECALTVWVPNGRVRWRMARGSASDVNGCGRTSGTVKFLDKVRHGRIVMTANIPVGRAVHCLEALIEANSLAGDRSLRQS